MLAPLNITDIGLPPKTLCLTYDDGPGPDSAELGEFLAARGVRATFFVVGKFAGARPQVLDALHAHGHIIGNHSFEHPDMPYYVSIDGDVPGPGDSNEHADSRSTTRERPSTSGPPMGSGRPRWRKN